MSDHSKIWQKKKSVLSNKEKTIRIELEEASVDFEKKVKTVLIIALVTGGVFVAANAAFRKKTSPKGQKTDIKKPTAKEASIQPRSGIKTFLVEQFAFAFVGFVLNKLMELISSSVKVKNAKDS